MFVTESDLREQLRRPAVGARVVVPAGARLSPAAADFVTQWKLVTEPESAAEPSAAPSGDHDWDKPSEFPVNLVGELPRCTTCGTQVREKVSALTQLNAHHYALKTHPRIQLRGRIDSLHAMVLLVQSKAAAAGYEHTAGLLGTLAAYCRELISAEYNERLVAELVLDDADAERIHEVTHRPDQELGIPHLTIGVEDLELQHWLNVVRTSSREIEILALEVFPSPHHPYGEPICRALNRLSSAFYYVQLLLKAGR